jgi:hypothetical protein
MSILLYLPMRPSILSPDKGEVRVPRVMGRKFERRCYGVPRGGAIK